MSKGIAEIIKEIRSDAKRTIKKEAIGVWREKDRLKGEIIDSLVVILRTRGCYWAAISGCSMCGYFNDTNPEISEEDLRRQLEYVKSKYNEEKMIKIYTSGSFLDDREVPVNIQKEFIESFKNAERIIVETRPEFVTDRKIKFLKEYDNVMVALGLESANDETLLYRINKGFTVSNYVKAAEKLNENDIPVKTYVLLKPPFMSERMAVNEAIYTVNFASKYSEVVSVNPMNIQNYTLVEYLWRRGEYRAPWLWSVVEVLKENIAVPAEVVSYPTAGGTKRGAHNCGKCDEKVLEAIYDFSLTQDPSKLEGLNCPCKKRWERIMNYEDYLWDYSTNS